MFVTGSHLSYKAKGKQILDGITFSVAAGEMLAVMGPSGSGKTSLLKMIAGQLKSESSEEERNGHTMRHAKRRIAFVEQDDVLFPSLTVLESLQFSAMLRLPADLSRQEKMPRVALVVRELGLERCIDTAVERVSGGERKRVSIGVEIVPNPTLLLLDDPTSELDSSTALKIMRYVQSFVHSSRTVITTIHQPSSTLFYMFHRLLLLSEGRLIYSGPAHEAMTYFASLHLIPELAMVNPSDFLLDLAAGDTNNIQMPAKVVDNTGLLQHLKAEWEARCAPVDMEHHIELPREESQLGYFTSWSVQFIVLLKRTFKVRSKGYFDWIKLCQSVFVAFMLGGLWWQSRPTTSAFLRDQTGLLFYMVVFKTTTTLFESINTYPTWKRYLVKELGAKMYGVSSFYLSSALADAVAELPFTLSFVFILYFMAGLKRQLQCFFFATLAVYLVALASQDLAGAVFMDVRRSSTAMFVVFLMFMLTGGFYVQHLPKFLRWIKYLSPVYHGYMLQLQTQYSAKQQIDCHIGCKPLASALTMDLNGALQEAFILVGIGLACRMLAYLSLQRLQTCTS